MNIKFKEQHLFEMEIFINVFTVTFGQFNVSFQNKIIHLLVYLLQAQNL